MSLELTKILLKRAHMLGLCREFFHKSNVIEVDCSSIMAKAPIDTNINVIDISIDKNKKAFLHTSPEYAMKKLLSLGMQDIYFLGHVFRQGEFGKLHNPEFTMAEWYRLGFSLEDMWQETLQFLQLFIPDKNVEIISYLDAFKRYADVDLYQDDLSKFVPSECKNFSSNEIMHFILATKVEPQLGLNGFTILTDFPPQEAALAKVVNIDGISVARRFEIYYKTVELANGYEELADANELLSRFEKENQKRLQRSDVLYEIDTSFLQAMEKGLPACSGVSVGFDRAFMLQMQQNCIKNILPNPWVG